MERRDFLLKSAALLALSQLSWAGIFSGKGAQVLKAKRIMPGNLIGLINPAGAVFIEEDVIIAEEMFHAMGYKTVRGKSLLSRYGYLAGTDQERADDLNEMFKNPAVDAIVTMRGGWGCNRILDMINYDQVAANPKILIGYSDITSLLVAINAMTGLVTFHGPVGISTWNSFTLNYFQQILCDGAIIQLHNPPKPEDELVQIEDRILTINPGTASGILTGGNLSVITSMLGSKYLPDWKGKILFVEEVGENLYRVDRMLTQLRIAGVLDKISGFIFGKCSDCEPGEGYGSLTLPEILHDHLGKNNIPAFYGSMIGHIKDKFTVPVGIAVEMNATSGVINMAESAVI